MSLVGYAYDSDEEDGHGEEGGGKETEKVSDAPKVELNSNPQGQKAEQPVRQQSQNATTTVTVTASSSKPSIEKLPDASLLLNSPDLPSHIFSPNNHASRVALAENASRKRAANGLPSSSTQPKLPKGNMSHSRNISGNGLLVPPQLSGRSNVVTEDISKLFVKKQADRPSQ